MSCMALEAIFRGRMAVVSFSSNMKISVGIVVDFFSDLIIVAL